MATRPDLEVRRGVEDILKTAGWPGSEGSAPTSPRATRSRLPPTRSASSALTPSRARCAGGAAVLFPPAGSLWPTFLTVAGAMAAPAPANARRQLWGRVPEPTEVAALRRVGARDGVRAPAAASEGVGSHGSGSAAAGGRTKRWRCFGRSIGGGSTAAGSGGAPADAMRGAGARDGGSAAADAVAGRRAAQ